MHSWKPLLAAVLVMVGAARAEASYAPQHLAARDVAARQSRGEAMLIVDIRNPEDYAEEHIWGACNVPSNLLDRSARGLPRNRTLVLYCTCPEEHGSVNAAAKLHDRFGYKKLAVLQGGLDAWRDAGYKVVSAARPQPVTSAQPWPGSLLSPRPAASSIPAAASPSPKASATPMAAPDQRDPMDEQRGTSQSP